MRVRTRSNILPSVTYRATMMYDIKLKTSWIQHASTGLWYDSWKEITPTGSLTVTEYFEDLEGPNHTFKPCVHRGAIRASGDSYNRHGYIDTQLMTNYITGKTVSVRRYSVCEVPFEAMKVLALKKRLNISSAPALTAITKAAARDALLGSPQPDMSIVNFAIELVKFDNLFKFAIDKHIYKTASGEWLRFNFGVLPFISDLKKIWDTRASVQRRLAIQKKLYAKPQKINGLATQETAWSNWSTSLSGSFTYRTRVRYKLTYAITARVRAEKPTWYGGFLAAIQSLGFITNPQIVWEAIPFSWTVDYFLPIQDTLGLARHDVFNPLHIGTLYGTSLKIESQVELQMCLNNQYVTWSPTIMASEVVYSRTAGGSPQTLLGGSLLPSLTFPNARQFSYILAVGAQRH